MLSLLGGCVAVSQEQQLQAARENIWSMYGGRQSGACRQPGAQRVTHPNIPLRYAHGLELGGGIIVVTYPFVLEQIPAP
jgi:hypothetical protein